MRLLSLFLVTMMLVGLTMCLSGALLLAQESFVTPPGPNHVVSATREAGRATPAMQARNNLGVLVDKLPPLDQRDVVVLTMREYELVDAINAYRAQHNLRPLRPESRLMACARSRSLKMNNCNVHHPGGVWPGQDARRHGYVGVVNEDYGCGFEPQEVVNAWASSYGHRMAMLGWYNMNNRWVNCHFDEIGVGVGRSGRNMVAMFGKRD